MLIQRDMLPSLQQAVKWERIYRNPADLIDLPRQKNKEMQSFTPEQAAKFMDTTAYNPFKALFSLLITSGMRPGEALGLKWDEIDFDGKKVTANRSLTRTKGGGWTLEEPKTPRSRRSIPLPQSVIADLKEHEKKQIKKIIKSKPETYKKQGFSSLRKMVNPCTKVMFTTDILNRFLKKGICLK